MTRLDYSKSHFKGPKYVPFKKNVLPGRVKCGGTEEEIVVAHGCRKRKKLICGPEEEIIVVAHGRLPSPAGTTICSKNINKQIVNIADENLTDYIFLSRYHY